MSASDQSETIRTQVAAAFEAGTPLYINGGGTKRHTVGRDCDATELNVGAHCGIVEYEPRELVVTVRAGTPVSELAALLAGERQQLAFEPPRYDDQATLGGTLACNLSGPARPWCGSIRDMVLGVQIVSGRGELLNFGGRVMKNVAGYDVSRLQAGALGTLGVITTVSLKVLPAPESTLTLCYPMSAQQALLTMNERARTPKPLTGACWLEGVLYLRLAGTASAVQHTATLWGGEQAADGDSFWRQLRETSLPCFRGDEPLWRVSCAPNATIDGAFDTTVIDWGGAQRWLRGDHPADALHQAARAAGGHACLFARGDRSEEVRGAVTDVERRLQQRLKNSFDPRGILNPGRLYSWL